MWFPNDDYTIVNRLVEILTKTLDAANLEMDVEDKDGVTIAGVLLDEALPPLLLVMGKVAKESLTARKAMKALVLPENM